MAPQSQDLCQAEALSMMSAMTSPLHSHRLPHLEERAIEMPDGTAGPLIDPALISRWRENWLKPSGVGEPTVLAINLEGRFPSPAVLLEIVVPLGLAARGRTLGPLTFVFCTSDSGIREILAALAEKYDVPLFVAPSVQRLAEAIPLGSLTPTESETLDIVRRLGGRVTVANFASASGLEPSAATNRLVNVYQKGFVHRVERPRRDGHLFLDPRVAIPPEDPADPTSGDFLQPEPVRADVQALTAMQTLEPSAIPTAVTEFFEVHAEQLSADHEAMRAALKTGDSGALAEFSKRYSKKQAQDRTSRLTK
jgi:hypothetical protein